mmetsp:Transcript_41509/g.111188  ORF Transcript_41509/g.111188 Transcript_41509/m.111188 type:complete len:232 (+) Transcript_41509:1885-2580(+)
MPAWTSIWTKGLRFVHSYIAPGEGHGESEEWMGLNVDLVSRRRLSTRSSRSRLSEESNGTYEHAVHSAAAAVEMAVDSAAEDAAEAAVLEELEAFRRESLAEIAALRSSFLAELAKIKARIPLAPLPRREGARRRTRPASREPQPRAASTSEFHPSQSPPPAIAAVGPVSIRAGVRLSPIPPATRKPPSPAGGGIVVYKPAKSRSRDRGRPSPLRNVDEDAGSFIQPHRPV